MYDFLEMQQWLRFAALLQHSIFCSGCLLLLNHAGGKSLGVITFKSDPVKIPCRSGAGGRLTYDVCFGYNTQKADNSCTNVTDAIAQAGGSKCKCETVTLDIFVESKWHRWAA
jgi:hypothetical protein